MLEVRDVSVRYGGIAAVREVSLDVDEGQLVTLVGPNGAGKSSLLGAICGLVPIESGEVLVDGEDLSGSLTHQIARSGLILVPEGRWILAPLSVQENLRLGRVALQGRDSDAAWGLDEVFELFPVLRDRRALQAGSLSGGEQQMLAIGRALMSGPRLLVLDEPSLGLAPIICDEVYEVLQQLKENGLTMLLVEQDARRALEVADDGYVISQGRIVDHAPAAELLRGDRVVSGYLGENEAPKE